MHRLQQQFYALGSEIFITLVASNDFPFEKTFSDIQNQIVAFETGFSRFLPNSELSQFNENAGETRKVSAAFRSLLLASKKMAEQTEGLFNPFILPALQKAGYKGSWPSPANLAETIDFSDRTIFPSSELQIYKDTAKIPPGAALDFGGIGKGYLLDQLHNALRPKGLHGYWLSLGGDLLCTGRDLGDAAWTIRVQHAKKLDTAIAVIKNDDGKPLFIATSGITKRRGYAANGSWHHLINPQTGKPVETDILTATVTSVKGISADIYAKVVILAGSNRAANLKQAGRIKSYVLQYRDKKPTINL